MTPWLVSEPVPTTGARAGAAVRFGTLALLACGAAGCASQASQGEIQGFRSQLAAGNFGPASEMAMSMSRPGGTPELLWSLNAGNTALYAGQADRTVAVLDTAETLMRASDVANFNWGATYRFGAYDAAMVNTYKALAMLSRGDRDGARVEMNRMDERQRRATERFQSEIAEARAATGRRDAGDRQALAAAENSPDYREQMQALERWGTYAPYLNPAVTYLHGVFFLTSGNPAHAERARNSFQRVVGMTGANPIVSSDMEMASRAARGQRPAHHTWIVFEAGQSPMFEQMNMTIPMPVYAGGRGLRLQTVTVSMPRMVVHNTAIPGVNVSAGRDRATTRPIASIEAGMASEFRQRYPTILASTVFEAIAKAAMVSGANAIASETRGVAGALLQVAAQVGANVTSSDTRSWYALPREFQVARIPTPANGRIELESGGTRETLTVPTGGSSIIYVKQQQLNSPRRSQVFPL